MKNEEIKHGVSVQKMRWRPGEVNMGKGGTLWAQEEGVKKDAENKEGRGKRGIINKKKRFFFELNIRIRDGGEGIGIRILSASVFSNSSRYPSWVLFYPLIFM